MMAITREFKQTVQQRALKDTSFREGLLTESIENMLAGDTELGKLLLRDYINATIGFEELGALTEKSPKSLMRMFSPSGNPTAKNLFNIIHTIQEKEGVHFQVSTVK
ncbi:transcriptional regulator [Teredinibacter turnerae]|uniref:hypothetical protein n=1 Tax=Teredinibacter turnerae TaxID=2426 RepID=UPI00035FCA62|nr:hypothetical protein [Teredinibacter turnerae]